MIQKKKVVILIISALLINVLLVLGNAQGEDGKTLFSKKVNTTPIIDGIADDAVWAEATAITTTNGIELKSVHKDDDIFFLAIWSDSTKSITKKEWIFEDSEWNPESSEEDSLAINWNIADSVANFNSQGCLVLCHPPQMRTNSPSEKIDVWQWKAARTNPSGWIEDKWMDNTGRDEDDKISGGLEENKQELDFVDDPEDHTDVPIYWEPGATGDDAKSITQSEINSGETRTITQIYMDGTMKDEDGTTIPTDTIIPFYYQSKPTGSTGDISAKGVWSNGKWTLEFSRKLNTGHSDDVQFHNMDKSYYFGIAIHDSSEGSSHHTDINVYELTFKADASTTDNGSESSIDNSFMLMLAVILILIVVIILVIIKLMRK